MGQESRQRRSIFAFVIALAACGPDEASVSAGETGDCPLGSEGCACTEGESCDAGLRCYSGLCVDPGNDTDVDPPASSTDPGSGGSSSDPDQPTASDPSDASSGPAFVCGDGVAEGDEACDGPDLRGATCPSEGFDLGELACANDCASFDTSGCWNASCGDGTTEADEMCDGADLGGATCVSEGFDGGVLACVANCTDFDTSGCGTCGNGIIDGDELCDGAAVGTATCQSEGFDSGALVCSAGCDALDTSVCGTCGNGVIDGAEPCDGAMLGAATCSSEGFDSGTLACASDCSDFLTTGCGDCGNGVIDGDELCDGVEFGGATCETESFDSGTLQCTAACSVVDTSGCGICGNDVIDGDEICDGTDLALATCTTEGFDSGALACTPDCGALDSAGCGLCGNGVVDGDELCDGSDLGGQACATVGFDSGPLQCIATCDGFDTAACGVCGNGVIDGDEDCDGGNLGGETCGSLGLEDHGGLGCASDCSFDVLGCCGVDAGGLTLQERIDAASNGDVIDVGPTVANVTIGAKQLTLRGNCTGVLSTWTCADTSQRAIRLLAGADVTIDGFVFEGCDGGALAAIASGVVELVGPDRVVVRNSVFRNNSGYRGAVISNGQGAALPLDGEVIIEHNIMHDNLSDDGGVIYIVGETNIRIHDNLIYANAAVDYCGAVWLRNQVQEKLVFTKNVVWGNTADRNPALEVFSGEGAIINSSIVTNNLPSNRSAQWGSVFSTIGGDPMFADPASGDFSLLPGSPAIDTGDPALPLDPDGTTTDRGVSLHLLPQEP